MDTFIDSLSYDDNNMQFSPMDDFNPTPKIDNYELADYVNMKSRLFFAEYADMSLNDILEEYQISSTNNRSISDIQLLYSRMQNSFAFHMFEDINFLECPISGIYDTQNGETWYAISDILTEPVYFCKCCGNICYKKFVISMDDNIITFKTVICNSSERYEHIQYKKVKELLPVVQDYKIAVFNEKI